MSLVHPAAPQVVSTSRMILRPPTPADTAVHHALHSDPRTYRHAPWSVTTDPDVNAARLASWVEGWRTDGVHYWMVDDRVGGSTIGVAGVRPDGGVANLYYRFFPEHHGEGRGREVARATTAWASEWLPTCAVRAAIRDDNPASVRTGLSAGLVPGEPYAFPGDPVEAGPSRIYRLPRVQVTHGDEHAVGSPLRDEMLDLWCAVNDAGGAVGFRRGASRDDVAAVLDPTLASTDDRWRVLAVMRSPEGRLLGFGWWLRDPGELFRHTATLKRFMVHPDAQGRNLGRVALAGMQAVARGLEGVEQCDLTYRSGLGLGRFYGSMGWTEVGRVPRAIRLTADDRRDSVWLVRGVAGGQVLPEGSP